MKAETVDESIALLDFTPDIKCESMFHGSEEWHEGPAEFFQRGPCAGSTGFRCGRYVRIVLSGVLLGACGYCGEPHQLCDLSFTPLSAN